MRDIEFRALQYRDVKVIKLKDYDNPSIYDEHFDKYFNNIDELKEWYDTAKWEYPKYVYSCTHYPFKLNLEDALEYEASGHYEDVLKYLKGITELSKAVDKFNELNKDNGSWRYNPRLIIDIE